MSTNYCKRSECVLSKRHLYSTEVKEKEATVNFKRIKEVFIGGGAGKMSLEGSIRV